ncbi:hypothetical protein E2C01_071227 [Portunus trituberculatus]|uniref:Uncharacterized protein n=1 Tax=Portunus trituberculatus TaxID=210409 RepID=A0A5B7I3U3_PORTR|nr:hypothetical protein [Portunus trituberculatus]
MSGEFHIAAEQAEFQRTPVDASLCHHNVMRFVGAERSAEASKHLLHFCEYLRCCHFTQTDAPPSFPRVVLATSAKAFLPSLATLTPFVMQNQSRKVA